MKTRLFRLTISVSAIMVIACLVPRGASHAALRSVNPLEKDVLPLLTALSDPLPSDKNADKSESASSVSTMFNVNLLQSQPLSLVRVDESGREKNTVILKAIFDSGSYTLLVDSGQLPTGRYLYELRTRMETIGHIVDVKN